MPTTAIRARGAASKKNIQPESSAKRNQSPAMDAAISSAAAHEAAEEIRNKSWERPIWWALMGHLG
jgi:hypothetical protein